MLNTFIWGSKRHRISHSVMRLPRNKRSLGIPDITIYHEAAQLANLQILNTEEKTDWMHMEFCNLNTSPGGK